MPRSAPSCPAQPPILRVGLTVLLLCAASFWSVPTQAEEQNQLWSVHAFGLKVGELHLSATQTANSYSGTSNFKTTGLAGVLRRVRFTISGAGVLRQGTMQPRTYDGAIDTGKRVSQTSLRRQNGVLVKTQGAQDPEVPIPAAATKGAFDPLSMMWLTLRDQSETSLCQITQTQFDGTRLVRITLRTRHNDADLVTCSGKYDRIGGYSAEELAELKTSPLSITYRKEGAVWRAQEVRLTSRHGKAKVIRQQ
ncbi:DUF3108 domain-containing protein [Shimia sp. NS0008-38b]|uniref:DUF3108 domain-containing protein n=1 Tax=Shimia sp. NS0008-38b TaxID=3127653 RepID=UPI00334245EC